LETLLRIRSLAGSIIGTLESRFRKRQAIGERGARRSRPSSHSSTGSRRFSIPSDGRLIEYDPAYCDVILQRFEAMTGTSAILARTGQTFEDVAAARTIRITILPKFRNLRAIG
jgi:hypothetical protein